MERSTELDKEAELAIKYMSDEEIREMFNTEQVDKLSREFDDPRREAARRNMTKRWADKRKQENG